MGKSDDDAISHAGRVDKALAEERRWYRERWDRLYAAVAVVESVLAAGVPTKKEVEVLWRHLKNARTGEPHEAA